MHASHPQTAKYAIGAPVACADGPCGEVSRLVVDPSRREITHLVVEPYHRHALARLVPATMVDAAGAEVRLNCSLAAFKALQYAQETEFLAPGNPWATTGYPNLDVDFPGASLPGSGMMLWPYYRPAPTRLEHERVPAGDVEIRRGEHIHAADGLIGKVQGLIVDPADRQVTHVLVQEGHFWGTKDVAIPIGAVTSIGEDGVHVSLSKAAIGDLPDMEVESSDEDLSPRA